MPTLRVRSTATTVLLALILLGPNAGCTTMRPVPDPSAPAIYERVAAGDRVRVATTDGRELEFSVTSVDEAGLSGVAGEETYELRYAEIVWLEVSEVDWARTVGKPARVAGGIVYAILKTAQVALLIAMVVVVLAS